MSNDNGRTPAQWESWNRLHRNVAIALALLLALLWLIGRGPGAAGACCAGPVEESVAPAATAVEPAVEAVPAAEPAAVAEPAPLAAPAELPRANLYFELDRFEVPVASDGSLDAVIAYLQANPAAVAVISGYHDPSGDKAYNEELAKKRAFAVRDAMTAAGLGEERFDMAKPIETTGSGDAAEARRVEVTVRP